MKGLIYFLVTVTFSIPFLAFAHDTGYSFEQVFGNYVFDIGYSAQPVQGELVRFDLSILKTESREPVTFTSAWVRVEKEGAILFAGPINYGQFGKPGFSYVFSESGNYDMYVRFEKGNDSIEEGLIQMIVAPEDKPFDYKLPLVGLIGLILGLVVGFLTSKLLKK